MKSIIIGCLVGIIYQCCTLVAQPTDEQIVQSGPMVGYSEMREVMLWVQTKTAAKVKFIYHETTNASLRFETDEVQTVATKAFCAHLAATEVEPGRHYTYHLYVNGKEIIRPYPLTFQTQALWQWRSEPPDFRFVAGSCAFMNEPAYDRAGQPYGGSYRIFQYMYDHKPDFMLWLGDNVYLREPDWNTRTGILKRYTHSRSIAELQPLLASTHHYAIWDDHDFGPNDSDRGFWNKPLTLEAFQLFWANPSYGVNNRPGITTYFSWADVEFFLLDNRYNRSPNNRKSGERVILGDEQIQWLIDALVSSRATFKIVCIGGQVLNPAAVYENYSTYPEERRKLLNLIDQEDIKGVIFLDGDRHHTELTKLERRKNYPLYDFTISPFTAGSDGRAVSEPNNMRVPGTFVGGHNFAVFEVKGPLKERILTCTVYDAAGNKKWTHSIKAKDLQ